MATILLPFLLTLSTAAGWLPTTLAPLHASEIARDSEAIVLATVASRECRYARGRDTIRTYVGLRDVVVCAGKAEAGLVLEFEGGALGDDRLDVPGMPVLEVGKTYLLCLSGNGRRPSPIVGFSQGAFEVADHNGRETLRTLRGLDVIGVAADRLVLASNVECQSDAGPPPGDGTPTLVAPSQDPGTRISARALASSLWSAR